MYACHSAALPLMTDDPAKFHRFQHVFSGSVAPARGLLSTVDTGNICEVIIICTRLHATTSKTSWWVGSLADEQASGLKMDCQLNIVHKLHG